MEPKQPEQIQNTTNNTPTSGNNSIPDMPYKDMQFEAFIQIIGEGNLPNWTIIAQVFGVDRSTITRWKNTPAARQAIKNAIAYHLSKMTTLGSEDWKMHERMLILLGVDMKQVVEMPGVENGLNAVAGALQDIYKQDGQRNTDSSTDKAVLSSNSDNTEAGQ